MSDETSASLPEQRTAATLDDAAHARLVAVVLATAAHGPVAMRRLWDDVVASYGVEAASRAWQEALSSSDVGQT
jgi:hypothetical protein